MPIAEVANVQTGPFGSQLKNEQYITGGTPVVTVEHIKDFWINNFDYPSVTDEDRRRLRKYSLESGDIVFSRVGSVDLSACVEDYQEGWLFSSRMLRVRPNQQLKSKFLAYFLQQTKIRRYIIRISVGSTMPSLNTEILQSLPIKYCSLAEQEKIASFLGSIDSRLTQLRHKHELLQAYKRGVMQKIFFQELRFPKFNNNWINSTLRAVTKYTKGFAFKSEDYLEKGIRIIRASDLDNQKIRQENQKIYISQKLAENDKIIKYTIFKGNIIISTVGSKPELRSSAVGRGIYVSNDNEGLLNQNLLKFENIEGVNNRFLFAQINTPRYVDYISSIQRGNANQSNITVEDLLNYQISMTNLEEQEKIADFLASIDLKLEAVAQQIDRTE